MVYLIKCSLCECNYIFIPHRDFLISVWFVCLESVCSWKCSWCAILKQYWPTVWLVFILDSLQFEDDAFPPVYIQCWYLHKKTMHQGTGKALKEYCQVPVFWFSPSTALFLTHPRLLIESKCLTICFLSLQVSLFLSSVRKAFPSSFSTLPIHRANKAESMEFLSVVLCPSLSWWIHRHTDMDCQLIGVAFIPPLSGRAPAMSWVPPIGFGYTEISLSPWCHGSVC